VRFDVSAERMERAILALALACAACSSAPLSSLGLGSQPPEPAPVETYPPWAVCGPVRVEARYYLDQAELMGGDLLEDYGLVPIALRLGVVPLAPEAGRLAVVPEELGLVLHLADGTALPRVAPSELAVRKRRMERLVREGLQGGLLPAWDAAREGFVYFLLPEGARASSSELTVEVPSPGGARTLDLRGSLVALELAVGGTRHAVRLGIQLDRHGRRAPDESEP
jgi:hypothetical protein